MIGGFLFVLSLVIAILLLAMLRQRRGTTAHKA